MTNMDLAWSMLSSPRTAFAELRERPRFLFPMVWLLGGTIAVLLWYFATVDFAWFQEQLFQSSPQMAQMSEEQKARAAAAMSKTTIMVSTVIGGGVGMLVVLALQAAYYTLAAKITNVQYGYKHWFSFAWWIDLPMLISIIAMALFLAMSDTSQVSSQDLQLLSLNELLFHKQAGDAGYTLLTTLTVIHPWVWALGVIGVQAWSGRSWGFSAVFALLPQLLVYGMWALVAFA